MRKGIKRKSYKYRDCILQYGIYPMINLLRRYEDKENYEECRNIRDALIMANEFIYDEIPIRDLEKIPKDWISDSHVKNLEYYIEKIKIYVN